jgi:hypothetical protein
MPRRPLPRLGGGPGDPAALLELDHVVLPDAALSQRHREHVACLADPLARLRAGDAPVDGPDTPGDEMTAIMDQRRRENGAA